MDTRVSSTLSDALAVASRRLALAGIEAARQDALILLSHVTGLTRAQLVTEGETSLSAPMQTEYERLLARRANREPVSHLLGWREFWSLPFVVSSAVLDPRPDSETLIQAALDHCPGIDTDYSVLDLGTGSGCLLLTLLSERPKATGIGLDISGEALRIAAQNADQLGLASRAQFLLGDWGASINGLFDIIVCNPPYVAEAEISDLEPEVAEFEPRIALDGGGDGLSAYRCLLPEIQRRLAPSGFSVVEIGADQGDAVRRMMEDCGLVLVEVRQDLAGIDRCIVCRSDPIFTVT